VIRELENVQGKVKQAVHDIEDKFTTLTMQGIEEILGIEAKVTKEVATTTHTSLKFIEAWRSVQ
jgi:hypothetical protein